MATPLDRLLDKLRVFYEGLPADEQRALEAILRQSQMEGGGDVAGFVETRPVKLPNPTYPFRLGGF